MLLLQKGTFSLVSLMTQLGSELVQASQRASTLRTPSLCIASPQEALLRRLLQRSQYSAAVVQMRMAVHLAGFTLPGPA